MFNKLTPFISWFYVDDEKFKKLDYAKLLTIIPLVSAIGYVILRFFSFFLTSIIFGYYGISMSLWSFDENLIFRLLAITIIIFCSIIAYVKYIDDSINQDIINKLVKICIKVSLCLTLTSFLLYIYSAINLNLHIIWQYIILFSTIIICYLIVHLIPMILRSSRQIAAFAGICFIISCILFCSLNTSWKKIYSTVHYETKNYIIGTSVGATYYLIEYEDGEILTDHYRFVKNTDVEIVDKKLELKIKND